MKLRYGMPFGFNIFKIVVKNKLCTFVLSILITTCPLRKCYKFLNFFLRERLKSDPYPPNFNLASSSKEYHKHNKDQTLPKPLDKHNSLVGWNQNLRSHYKIIWITTHFEIIKQKYTSHTFGSIKPLKRSQSEYNLRALFFGLWW